MSGFIEGTDRHQATLFPERLDDYVAEDSSVRVIDVFIDDLDLSGLGFKTDVGLEITLYRPGNPNQENSQQGNAYGFFINHVGLSMTIFSENPPAEPQARFYETWLG